MKTFARSTQGTHAIIGLTPAKTQPRAEPVPQPTFAQDAGIDTHRVAEILAAVATGQYKVNHVNLASKMLDSQFGLQLARADDQ